VQLDDANRVESMRRGPSGDPVMTADYTYYGNGLIDSVTYGNGAGTLYEYDDANRLTVIEHDDGAGVLLRMEYTYTANSLPDTITESDDVSTFAVVDYAYDTRGRLVHEDRDDGDNDRDYDLTYTYDQGGNRLKKIDAVNDVEVQYHYDLEDPGTYQSANNRLVYFEVLPDPRHRRNRRHLLVDVITIAVCGVIVGCDGPAAIRIWAKPNEEWLKGFLELPNGIPSRDCIRRVLTALKPEAFQECFWRGSRAC
jgi:hypothetical protein